MNRHARTFGVGILVALSAVGTVRGATTKSTAAVTTKVMVAELEANHYPVAHPEKLTCRGLGTAVKDGHTSFRCVASV